jgi:hypothetical protein
MPERRTLKSDVLLTRAPGGSRYLLFRDVFEVDGREVRDRDERLLQLFLEPSASTSAQARRILDESARYNLGDIGRTINTPTLALVFLDPQYRPRLRFEPTGDRVPETIRDAAAADGDGATPFTLPPDVSLLAFQETARDTMVGTGTGGNLRASGRFWIEPATGRVLLTEIQFRNETIAAVVDVRYDLAPEVGIVVPVAMRERYRDLRRDDVIAGSAAYSRVRRFQVASSEVVGEPAR